MKCQNLFVLAFTTGAFANTPLTIDEMRKLLNTNGTSFGYQESSEFASAASAVASSTSSSVSAAATSSVNKASNTSSKSSGSSLRNTGNVAMAAAVSLVLSAVLL